MRDFDDHWPKIESENLQRGTTYNKNQIKMFTPRIWLQRVQVPKFLKQWPHPPSVEGGGSTYPF